MAAYAATVTSSLLKTLKIDDTLGIGVYVGKCDITNYNQTNAEITGITGKFKTVLAVIAGATDLGYLLEWKTNTFKAWTFEDTNNVPVQVASDIDVGEGTFIAIGII